MTPPPQVLTERQMIDHLLFHKAIHSEDGSTTRLDEYIRMLRERGEGSHVAFTDPFDRSIALAFELVLEQGMDPWHIDLVRFTALYLERVREGTEIDLITAGKLLHMAWSILKLQSEQVRLAAEPPPAPEPETLSWDDMPLEAVDDPDAAFTDRVLMPGEGAPIDEKVRHKGDRKVTLMELMDALEEARREAELRKAIVEARESEKANRRAKRKGRAEDAAHKDDQEGDIAEVWERILGRNGIPIPITDIQAKTREDMVKTLVSILFLARDNRIHVWQQDFPYGMIFLQNRQAHGYVDMRPAEPEPTAAKPKRGPPKKRPKSVAMAAEVKHVQN
jgi:segregation and condensation protein A